MLEEIIGLGALLLCFGIALILAGLYIYTGHRSKILLWRAGKYLEHMTKEELKNIGKIIIIIGLVIGIIGGVLIIISGIL